MTDVQQMAHVARLAFLAMAARGVAAAEFDSSPEIAGVHISVARPQQGELDLVVDVEYMTSGGHIIGGLTL